MADESDQTQQATEATGDAENIVPQTETNAAESEALPVTLNVGSKVFLFLRIKFA